MLKCVLGDGSVFEKDRKLLTDLIGIIKDMLEEDDTFKDVKKPKDHNVSEDDDISNLLIPLPLVPSYQRMKNVVENTKDLSLMDLIHKINDADYLNCQDVIKTCSDELVQIIENGTEEVLETIVEHTVPTVLGLVLLSVNCIPIIQNFLIDFNSFPLPFHLQTILQGCGILYTKDYLKLKYICKILLYCVNVRPNTRLNTYIDEYITMIRKILKGKVNRKSRRCAVVVGTIINDISLVEQAYDPNDPEIRLEFYDLVGIAASMGRTEIIDLFLKDKSEHEFNLILTHALNAACEAGLTDFPTRLIDRFTKDIYVPFLNPNSLLFLFTHDTQETKFKTDHQDFLHYIYQMLFRAVEEDNIEFCKFISQREDFKEIMENAWDRIDILSRCTDREIMRILLKGYPPGTYTLENLSEKTCWWTQIAKRKRPCPFGIMGLVYTSSPKKILSEILENM